MESEKETFKVGSRKKRGKLALIQTNLVIDQLKEIYPKKKFEVVTMSTIGDQILDRPLPKIGEKSLFTKELETALVENKVDLVVHSLKDMPTSLPDGLAIGAILRREDPRDAVILHNKHQGQTLATLPPNSIIGTSSLRRTAQLKRKYPDLIIKDIRGNLQTRREKLRRGDYDGIILAFAGIMRMGWDDSISQVLDEDIMLYAVGQGALAVECRVDDCHIFAHLNHKLTVFPTIAERSLLNTLGGGCSAPVAVWSSYKDGTVDLTAAVWSLDGSITLKESLSQKIISDDISDNEIINTSDKRLLYCGMTDEGLEKHQVQLSYKLGVSLAQKLITGGAIKIIEDAKEANSKS